ncbi:MAG TPA: hypothetical protein VIL42_03975 [Sphingomicrobium sp.]
MIRRGRSRAFLRRDVIFYVRPDGDDGNDGLADTPRRAFANPQRAIDIIYRLDLRGFEARVHLAPGTYSGRLTLYGLPTGARHRRSRPIRLFGDEENPSAVVIRSDRNAAIEASRFANLLVAGITFENDSPEGDLWLIKRSAFLDHRNCILGASAGEKIRATNSGSVRAMGPTTVRGDGLAFVHATSGGLIDFAGQQIHFEGTPHFSRYIWGINDASVNIDSATISGTVRGGGIVYCNGMLNVSSLRGNYRGGDPIIVQDGGRVVDRNEAAHRALWVRSEDGNDNNDGRMNTPDRAFRTLQGAIDALARMQRDTIEWQYRPAPSVMIFARGRFEETVWLRDVGLPEVSIIGDKSAAERVVINGRGDALVCNGSRTKWSIRSLTLSTQSGSCLHVSNGAQVSLRDVQFGEAGEAHILVDNGARVAVIGRYSIAGSAQWHIRAQLGGTVDGRGRKVDLQGTPRFGKAFAAVELNAVYSAGGALYLGQATGPRFKVRSGGLIDADGARTKFLPGDLEGTVELGGLYC